MGVCFGGSSVRVGTEWTDAVWNDGQESCKSEDRMMMSSPNDEQFGFTVRVGLSWGSSDVCTKSTIVVSFVAGGWGLLATVCSIMSFFTVASACVLRVLRSGVDFAMVDTVLLEGVDIMKSAAEEDAAMMKGFECPGECSSKIRVVFFSSSLMLTGLRLKLKILLCFKAAILSLVSLVLAIFGLLRLWLSFG